MRSRCTRYRKMKIALSFSLALSLSRARSLSLSLFLSFSLSLAFLSRLIACSLIYHLFLYTYIFPDQRNKNSPNEMPLIPTQN